MKKIAVAVLALALAPAAFAGELAANSATPIQVTADATGCELLSESINVSLSKGVAGGYSCNTGTNVIAVTTCNPDGKKTGTNNNFYTVSGSGGKMAVASDAACSAGAAATKAGTAAGVATPEPEEPAEG